MQLSVQLQDKCEKELLYFELVEQACSQGGQSALPPNENLAPPLPKKLEFFKDFEFCHKIKLDGKSIFLNYFC